MKMWKNDIKGAAMPETAKMPGKIGAVLISLIQIVLSLLGIGMGSLILLIPRTNPALDQENLAAPALFYFGMGVFFLAFAVATVMGKRWARTLMLIFSWYWLIVGLLGTVNLAILWPSIENSMEAAGKSNPTFLLIMEIIMFSFFLVFFVLIPGIFVLFYGRKKAKENFEAWDPKESWTDRCPAPVLALSLCASLGVVLLIPFMAFYHFVVPFFGTILEGGWGALACLVTSAVLAYVAWGIFHLKMTAWWTQLGVFVLGGISTVWTFSTHTILEMDEKMGVPQATLDRLHNMPMFNDSLYWATYMGVVFALYIGYLVFIRKYFKKRDY
jgi:hypothetical protein